MSYTHENTASWRREAGSDNPAGPLFTSGDFAAADIVCEASEATLHCTGVCGSDCSGSATAECC